MKGTVIVILFLLSLQSSPSLALGRLFMTPEQRLQLSKKPDLQQSEQLVIIPTQLHINGFVKPQNSASTLWINGSADYPKLHPKYSVGRLISPVNKIAVDLQGTQAQLRPGQTIDIESREVLDTYARKPNVASQVNETVEDTSDETQDESRQQPIGAVDIEDVKQSLKTLKLINNTL